MRVFKIEVRGRGFVQYEFQSVKDAEDFAAACFWWGGSKYRIFPVVKRVAQGVAA